MFFENGVWLYHENVTPTEFGYWVEAKDLRVGDVFLGVNGKLSTLTNIVRVEQDGGIAVFNFKVEGNHNYYILAKEYEYGQSCILVHNADCPNPFGRQGCEEHQAKIAEIAADIEARGLTPDFETSFELTAPGVQGHLARAADVTAWDGDKLVEIHQVGKSLADGLTGVARERYAIEDIESVSKPLTVQFHAYDK